MQKLHWAAEQTLILGITWYSFLSMIFSMQNKSHATCKYLVPCSDAPSLQTIAAQNALLPADHVYDQIELKPKNVEVEVSANAAYGMGRR